MRYRQHGGPENAANLPAFAERLTLNQGPSDLACLFYGFGCQFG